MGNEVLLEIRNNVAHITLNRPQAANSLNIPLCHELLLAANHCDSNPEVRAVLIKANGRFFCAGGDVKGFLSFGDACSERCKEMVNDLHGAVVRFQRMDAPVVIAVHGPAAGAGLALAASGDITLAAESAKFSAAYTAAGLTPDGSSTWMLPRLIGKRKALELILTNKPITATEAADMDLINKVVPDDELMREAEKLAEQLAEGPTKAFGKAKRLVLDSFNTSLESHLDAEARAITDAMTGDEFKEGAAAFVEKRKPNFVRL